jgi:molybdopterin-guanine dinucleotide biosynthesis protein B
MTGPVVLGVVAPSGTGKTTLLCQLVPRLRKRGLRVGAIKYTHHDVEVDRPGKDSYRIREAGASQVMLISRRQWTLIGTREPADEFTPDQAVARMDTEGLNLVLVEGYRGATHPKIEVYRAAVGAAPLYPSDERIMAVVSDDPLPVPTALPVLGLGDPDGVADFLETFTRVSTV